MLPAILALWKLEGVGFVHFVCDEIIWHVVLEAYGSFDKHASVEEAVQTGPRVCKVEGVWQFMTALACAYPPELGMVVGEAFADGLKVRRERIEIGQEVPMLTPEEDMGNPMLQAMCDKQGRLNNKTFKWWDDGVPGPGDGFLEEQVVAGEQSDGTEMEPNSGGALLKDILAEEHMEWATTLQHAQGDGHTHLG